MATLIGRRRSLCIVLMACMALFGVGGVVFAGGMQEIDGAEAVKEIEIDLDDPSRYMFESAELEAVIQSLEDLAKLAPYVYENVVDTEKFDMLQTSVCDTTQVLIDYKTMDKVGYVAQKLEEALLESFYSDDIRQILATTVNRFVVDEKNLLKSLREGEKLIIGDGGLDLVKQLIRAGDFDRIFDGENIMVTTADLQQFYSVYCDENLTVNRWFDDSPKRTVSGAIERIKEFVCEDGVTVIDEISLSEIAKPIIEFAGNTNINVVDAGGAILSIIPVVVNPGYARLGVKIARTALISIKISGRTAKEKFHDLDKKLNEANEEIKNRCNNRERNI